MKASVKRATDTLEALGFHAEPHPFKRGKMCYWHANEPETMLSLFVGMSDAAASKVVAHAEAIVGLAHTETDKAQEKADREAAKKRRDEAERLRQVEAQRKRVAQRDAEIRAAQHRAYSARQRRGVLTHEDRLHVLQGIKGDMISPARIADELCISDAKIRDAINSDELTAYMCGKQIMCRLADVRAWVKAGAA